jgi:NADPH:quinone reductase-like Zn-dependent oxidoreductase
MKAYTLTGFGAAPVFLDAPRPELGDADVLVRLLATSVNPVDRLVASGFFRTVQEYRFPAIFGRDLAGVVEETGPGVTSFIPGDRVWGFVKREHIGNGTFAEFVAVPEDFFIAAVPEELSMRDAGVLGMSSVTALECVEAVKVSPGDMVLVNGATGGVGSYAVQIAVAQGATVIAAARPGQAADHARGMGASFVVDWTRDDLVDQVRQHAPDGVDGLVDVARYAPPKAIGVGEEEKQRGFAELARGVLRPAGRASSTTNGGVPELLGDIECLNVHSTPSPGNLRRINDLVIEGRIAAPIDSSFSFDQLPAAFERLASGRVLGKVSVEV